MAKSIILVQKQMYFNTSAEKIKEKQVLLTSYLAKRNKINNRQMEIDKIAWRKFLFSDF